MAEGGSKAPVGVKKRTNKAVDGWSERAAVRLPGLEPLVICEGVETALSVWLATGRETWACLGISNLGKAPVPNGASVLIARDGNAPGSPADAQLQRAAAALTAKGAVVSIATPPLGEDVNDVLLKAGPEAVRAIIDEAQPFRQDGGGPERKLSLGSDVEIARLVREDLSSGSIAPIFAEGAFWRFNGSHWAAIPHHELRLQVHTYDGAPFEAAKGKPTRLRLGKARIDSILNECAALCAAPEFFKNTATGINCASGFVHFDPEGTPHIESHSPDHRCRHTLPGRWSPEATGTPPAGSLLARFLDGIFRGDVDAKEKDDLLAEVCGAAALGYATKLRQPRAVIRPRNMRPVLVRLSLTPTEFAFTRCTNPLMLGRFSSLNPSAVAQVRKASKAARVRITG